MFLMTALLLTGSLWIEVAFGLYGCFFAASLLLFPGAKRYRMWYVALLFVTTLLADLVYQRPAGETAVTLGVVLLVWNGVRRLSRWRFFAYLGLGMAASLPLSGYKGHILIISIMLIVLWGIVRLVNMMTKPTEIRAA